MSQAPFVHIETHTIKEGEGIQIGDARITLKGVAHDRATLKVVASHGTRIKRVEKPPAAPCGPCEQAR